MRVRLDYHREGIEVEIPDANLAGILELKTVPPLANPEAAVRKALANPAGSPPLAEIAKGKRTACVVISDITRPVPNSIILPSLLAELESGGPRREDILILVATGLHRPNEGEELRGLVGDFVFEHYRIENHDARDAAAHRHLGKTSHGMPIRIDARYLDADLKILTGLVEPHFMAGFSAGRKGVCPGIASAETICAFHGPDFIEHERSRTGILEGNPTHAASLEAARAAGVDFTMSCVLNAKREIVGVFAGELEAAFQPAVNRALDVCVVEIDEPADVVVTSAAGYPLDLTWYQAIKGIVVCMPAVKPGGTILLAAGIREGIGSEEFTKLCFETKDLEAFMRDIRQEGRFTIDQWELEEYVLARRHANVMLYTDGLDRATQARLLVEPVDSVEHGLACCFERYGAGARVLAIPKGPYVLPAVKG